MHVSDLLMQYAEDNQYYGDDPVSLVCAGPAYPGGVAAVPWYHAAYFALVVYHSACYWQLAQENVLLAPFALPKVA